ncbi:MAG: 4-diphosphocytidyl-2C-methyl-D-erythritol kinase [Coriobacteriia bacterium]|nr:4-diphosphocytidyl-2C-methyl-D-erythritol kinase [Coriobacteriia bacterium]MBN2823200.1 4-diphosphocytidyl-2C-methyl-D-erythritol kinase [Coriobacteriia bacterium]
MGSITLAAPAKVNLYLAVGPRRPDGHHDLVSVFQALELADVVVCDPDAPFSVTYEPDLGLVEGQDLVSMASSALAMRLGREPRGAFKVRKYIPAAGGLGGGSSDAAAAIVALCHAWDVPIDDPSVVDVARSVGADVAFFLVGGTALYVGRGDTLARRLPDPGVDVVLVNPGEPVPTSAAFAAFDRMLPAPTPPVEPLVEALVADDVDFGTMLFDGMTEVSVGLVPSVGDALAFLRAQPGVLGAEMAGSGSTVFAVCSSAQAAEQVAEKARAVGWWSEATRTSGLGAHIISV